MIYFVKEFLSVMIYETGLFQVTINVETMWNTSTLKRHE